MKKVIIIRFCEIHLKGKNRGYFEKMLQENIKRSVKDIDCVFEPRHNRYVISSYSESDYPLLCGKLKKIPGVHSFSEAREVITGFDAIAEIVKDLARGKEGTFRIETNRADKTFPLSSMAFSAQLGEVVLGENPHLKVQLKNPDYSFDVDIREDGKTYIFCGFEKCLSGMPVGSAGRGLLLISGGIDSPVAGYMTAKRGMKLELLHFHSYPYTGELAKEKVINLSKIVGEYNGGVRLHTVSVCEIQENIHEKCPEEFMITILRRFMMRIAEKIAVSRRLQAIVTGESLGQVASQTIESITSSNSVVTLPVLRPLIAFDKIDIIDVSRKINAYDISVLPYEDCCTVFLPKHPVIKPNLKKVCEMEKRLDVDRLIENAISTLEEYSL